MDFASHSVGLQSKINISISSTVDIVLVEDIIQTLIEVFKVQQDNCSSSLHTKLYLVDVSTHLNG